MDGSTVSASTTSTKKPMYRRVLRRTAGLFSEGPKEHEARKAAANLPTRRIYVNMEVPEDELPTHAQHYCTNAITTSQYTLISFLPKNLARQFRRVANIYFLVLTILQLISYFSVGSRFLTVVPIILVLTITAVKDAFEDWRRHISDKHFNETPTRLVRNHRNTNMLWQENQTEAAKHSMLLTQRIRLARQLNRKTWYNQIPSNWELSENPVDPAQPPILDEHAKWRNVRVGDFVILRTGDPAPSDILVLATSADDGSFYVETKNLDGETNLKQRASLAETAGVRDPEGCGRLCAVVEVDAPSSNMTKLNGSIRILSVPTAPETDELRTNLSPITARPLQSPGHPPQFTSVSPRQMSTPFSSSGENYEMKLLGPRQAQPLRQSPLALPPTKSEFSSHFHGDDELGDAPPSYDMDTTVPSSSTDSGVGKSLPKNIDFSSSPPQIPFSISNILLRGMTVRNTDWIVGIVLYTGDQSKIVLNSGATPYKRSRIERMMNKQVVLSFAYVFVTSFIVAIVGGIWYAKPDQRYSAYVDSSMGTGLYGFALFWSAMIMLQNVIPIALYVSIEFVKSWHVYWIYQDINMYYEPTDQRCVARNWNISDDLGQVSYIFSDKTGTLTRNVMDFRMCTINGTIYGKQLPGDELDVVKGRIAQEEVDRNNPPEGGANPFFMEIQNEDNGFGRYSAHPDEAEIEARQSTTSSIASNGTSQYDSSPLISTADAASNYARLNRVAAPALRVSNMAPVPAPVPIGAAHSRTRTTQALTEEEAQAKRRRMIQVYTSALRNVFEPTYVELGNEETGEGGSYTFVDPQLFYDMKPEVAPRGTIKGVASPHMGGEEQGLSITGEPMQRIGSHRSFNNGFDVDPQQQRDAIDLFLTELATCHSVVVEKSFQKQINSNNEDDRSTLGRLTRIFHSRNGSRKITDKVRHMRHRSKHHGRTESAATASSFGGDVEFVASETGSISAGHARNPSSASMSYMRLAEPGSTEGRANAGGSSMPQSATAGFFGEQGSTARVEQEASAQDLAQGLAQALGEPQSAGSGASEPKDVSKLPYSAESPDEGALVRAAKNFGYTFLGRIKSTIFLDVRGEKRQYEVLDTIDFDSTRKRMSTILRRPPPHNDIVIFTKGADNVMIERLCKLGGDAEEAFGTREEVKFERAMRERTFSQIDEFANAGLRTLVLCYRRLSESEWVRWSARYHAAQASLDADRDERIEQVTEEMERDLRIAGATAIEDKLQERVPDTIAALRAAGIKIWVLTGDKMETAINIGFAANLLTKEMELWTLSSSSGADEIITRFRLIARIMRSMAAAEHGGGSVGLGVEDAQTLGSVSYKIGRAHKFLHIGETLRQRRVRRNQLAAGAAIDAPRQEGLSPAEVQQSINFLRRHSSVSAEGVVVADEQDARSGYQPLNALVIDGGALSILLADAECRALMLEIAPLFKSVVCCRASPLQKAEVVRLVKDGLDLVTLAIGDGANDVSMIQTADIGVAISGEEGLQASMASDYTVGRFHFLQNLLLVHGLYDYLRMSEMILTFFYKNVIWAMVPFWYSIYCSFSANIFYDLSYIQLYNVVFTVAPVAILGCIDKPFNYRTAMTYVAVYSDGIRNRYYQWWRYYLYVIDGIYQSVVIFFTFYLFTYWSDVQNSSGRTWGRSDLSTGPTVAVVIAASLCVGFNSWQWNWIMAVAILLSIVVCLAYVAVSSAVRYYSLEGVATAVMSTVQFWFGVIIAVVVAMLPRYSVHCWQKLNRPRDLDIIREIKILHRPWYGQVFVEPDAQIEFPVEQSKHHRYHLHKHKK